MLIWNPLLPARKTFRSLAIFQLLKIAFFNFAWVPQLKAASVSRSNIFQNKKLLYLKQKALFMF